MSQNNNGKTNLIFMDSKIRWVDEETTGDEDEVEISSEEESKTFDEEQQRHHDKNLHEIWPLWQVWNELQAIADTPLVVSKLRTNQLSSILSHNPRTILLVAAWQGHAEALRLLINKGVNLQQTDQSGRSGLHLAALTNQPTCIKLLLDNNHPPTMWDLKRLATPLHCAASMNHVTCVKLLIEGGADVNAGVSTRSPLLCAVQSRALQSALELLQSGASPDTPQIFSETPLHLACSMGQPQMIKLLLDYNAAVNVQSYNKLTPLHLAAEDGDSTSVSLLLENGASVAVCNHKGQTPLHLAALAQSAESIELLLKKHADPNLGDCDGRTSLHCAIVKVSRSCDCVRSLLLGGADVNKPDKFGYTAMHLAALNEFSSCLLVLLQNGGDVTVKTKGGTSVLTFITRKTPEVIPQYIAKFDQAIKLNDHNIGDVDCEVKLDFRVLIPTKLNMEMELLLNFIEVGHKEVLKHPLCETFLFLKWRRIRKFFLFSLAYHSLFVLLYTLYVVGVFLNEKHLKIAEFAGYVLLALNLLMLGKEIFQIGHNYRVYVKHWDNWLQWSIIISVFLCVQPSANMKPSIELVWQRQVAATGIFLAWVELMMIVGRFPIFGLYIQMFTTVSLNFIKFILAYFCLFIAFVLSFCVVFARYKTWTDLKWILIKVIIMMSSELEFEDVHFIEKESSVYLYPYTTQIMIIYLLFVVLITIILTNLMVGLAVSDIQGLQQSAGLDRLVRQAQLVAHLESMLFSGLLKKCFPRKLLKFLHHQALLLKTKYHWALYIKPNDPREERIPKDLIKNIYQLVAERKDRPTIKRKSKQTNNDLHENLQELQNSLLQFQRKLDKLTCKIKEL